MSIDRGASNGKTMLYDDGNNYSSCVSASMPNKEESVASNSSRRCVDGVSANNTPALPELLIGSDEENERKSMQINDSIIVGNTGNKDSEQTEFGSSTKENRPIFSIIFRNRDIARLVSCGSELE